DRLSVALPDMGAAPCGGRTEMGSRDGGRLCRYGHKDADQLTRSVLARRAQRKHLNWRAGRDRRVSGFWASAGAAGGRCVSSERVHISACDMKDVVASAGSIDLCVVCALSYHAYTPPSPGLK